MIGLNFPSSHSGVWVSPGALGTGCRKGLTLPRREGTPTGDEDIQAALGGICASHATSSLGIWAESSWVSVASRSFPTKAWRRKVRKLGKPLIAALNRASVACCEALGAGVVLKAAWGHKPDTVQRITAGLVECQEPCPGPAWRFPAPGVPEAAASLPAEWDAVV